MKLNPDSIDWALRHITKYQTYTSLFPKPYEFDAISDEWVSVKKYLTDLNLPEDWKIREARKIFAPKSYNGFRFCTQLDPLDEIIYYALQRLQTIIHLKLAISLNILMSNLMKLLIHMTSSGSIILTNHRRTLLPAKLMDKLNISKKLNTMRTKARLLRSQDMVLLILIIYSI